MSSRLARAALCAAVLAAPIPAVAQDTAAPSTPAAPQPAPPAPARPAAAQPSRLPPAGSPPLVRTLEIAFPKQPDGPMIESQTYLYYIQTRPSRPSEGVWVPYHEPTVLEDFKRLWATNFLDDLSIEVRDVPWDNGVVGKHVIFNMEERRRVKIVDYTGTKVIDQTKIEEILKEENITIRLDSFLDPTVIRRVEGIIRGLMAEKGYQDAEVSHELRELPGGPKLVHLAFTIKDGPKIRIREVEFDGNQAISDGRLRRQMKENKAPGFFSFFRGGGTFHEGKFAEDAERVVAYYRDRGYIAARVGQPEIVTLADSPDGKRRDIKLKIPVQEGKRYRVGDFSFDGVKVIKLEALRPLFKLQTGDYYSDKRIRKGLETARELYGTVGYWEFTGYPDLKPRDQPSPEGPDGQGANGPDAAAKAPGESGGAASNGPEGQASNGPDAAAAAEARPSHAPDGAPYADVIMRMQEGDQYFVNRITFAGNTTTRDNVIRREVRLLEQGVFNTEALKYSVKRINQLGYFKTLEEGEDTVKVEKTAGEKNMVDVTLKFEEQNRNQLTFGAGVSQFEGFFGQLSFQTSNFMGRGESATFAVLAGRRAKNYQFAFTEPFLFDRPITAGLDLYKRELQYIFAYTQASTGGNVSMGFPVADFSRLFVTYSLSQVSVKDIDERFLSPEIINRNIFLRDALLQGEGGKRTVSQITPAFIHNTIDNPIFPTRGTRLSATFDVAGFGGNVNFVKPRLEGVWMFQHTRRTSLGFRGQLEYLRPWGSTVAANPQPGESTLPIFERLFLGGEYSVRGYDIRSIGPRDIGTPEAPGTGIVIGGDKSLLFNAEYLITIAGPVRLVLFYDAGQVSDFGQSYAWDQFKTSTGAEIRFFMPVLNVPFRLIFAHNPQRTDVFENDLTPAKKFTFKFAVGSTF
jgi:outer membrane protein insertion porin family